MKGDPVPDTDHILRYVGGSHVDVTEHGQPYLAGSGFIAKPKDHNRPSYNWLECMEGTLEQQVQQVRDATRLNYRPKGKLARLNVGQVRGHVESNTADRRAIAVLHDPLDPEDSMPADPSHAIMTNVPDENDPEGELIGDLIAECIIDVFPAVISSSGR